MNPTTSTSDELERKGTANLFSDHHCLLEKCTVSWSAIFAGALAAAALSLILLILGTSLGISSISPWANVGISAKTLGISAIAWITITQLLASGMGGYLTGRLRTKQMNVHTDEIYFRDTAHGFLSWAISLIVSAVLLTSAIGSIISNGAFAGAEIAKVGAKAGSDLIQINGKNNDSVNYFIDSLFRQANNAVKNTPEDLSKNKANIANEISHIFTKTLSSGNLADEDKRYVAQLISQYTGISPVEAEQRVTDTYATLKDMEVKARVAADQARKASAYTLLWIFISLLMGAFIASLAATWGGRHRLV